jgi:hypothetical protein
MNWQNSPGDGKETEEDERRMRGGWEEDGREMSWQELAEHQDAVVVGVEAREE